MATHDGGLGCEMRPSGSIIIDRCSPVVARVFMF